MNKILAVDDNEDILFTLETIAEHADFKIETIDSSYRALKLLENNSYDMIIVDYHMPKMNGLKLVKKIRIKNKNIPILVLTVDESLELSKKFLSAGSNDFATKPIRAADLISRINLHLKLNNNNTVDDYEFKDSDFLNNLILPKGLTKTTLKLVVKYMKKNNKPVEIRTISDQSDLSYQTVHRYLDFLLQKNYLDVKMEYGKVGRPIKKYYIKS